MTDNIGDESSKLRREGIPFAARMGEFAPESTQTTILENYSSPWTNSLPVRILPFTEP